MKRRAEEDGPEGRAKRQAAGLDSSTVDLRAAYLDPDSESDSNDASPTTAQTPLTTASTVSRRSRKFPSDLKTIDCPYPDCPKTFNRPARLAAHLRSHSNERPFKCTYPGCTKSYIEEKHLKQHIKGSHTQERKYICPEPGCGASFTTGTRLRRHADVHAGAERFRCREHPPCSRAFRKHQTLQRHVRTDHLGQSAYPCEVDGCGAGHETAGALKRHVQREHGEIRFFCDECGLQDGDGEPGTEEEEEGPGLVGFTSLALLNAHLRVYHVGCHFCDARLGSQGELERHMDIYHSGATVEDRKTVACEWEGCQKTFVKQANLTAHVRTAHEGFRFVCGVVDMSQSEGLLHWNEAEEGCAEGFTTKVKLEQHVRHVHLGQKRPKARPSTVPVVDRPGAAIEEIIGFSDSRRPILCTVATCSASFARHSDLTMHVTLHHGTPSEDVEMTDGIPEDPYPLQGLSSTGRETGLASSPDDAFWIEADEPLQPPNDDFMDDWEQMRRLIDLDA